MTAGDSWFAGLKTVMAFLEAGEDFIGDVKTNHSNCCIAEIVAVTPNESGGSAVYTTTVTLTNGSEKEVYLVSHRRGPKVHVWICTCGTTLPGNPRVRKVDGEEGEAEVILERKCPKILNDYTTAQPIIDRFNRYRQHELAMEKRIHTKRFDFRHAQFMWAEVMVNAFFAQRHFNENGADFRAQMNFLAYRLMTNPLLRAERGGDSVPRGLGGSRDSGGGCSSSDKFGSHTVVSLREVMSAQKLAGYKRKRVQMRCTICGMHVSTCCLECSNETETVPLHRTSIKRNCERTSFDCLRRHRRNPSLRGGSKGKSRSQSASSSWGNSAGDAQESGLFDSESDSSDGSL